VTDVGLKELAVLRQLKSLNLYGCTKVTNEGVRELEKAIPKLQVVR
jgi:hypothetical protein